MPLSPRAMFRREFVTSLIAGLCLAHPAHAEPSLIPKQLTAPPEDFLTGMLRLPQAELTGRASVSAVLPITLAPTPAAGSAWETTIDVKPNREARFFVLSSDAEGLEYEIVMPSGRSLNTQQLATDARVSRIRDAKGMYYAIRPEHPGAMRFRVSSPNRDLPAEPRYLLIADGAPILAYTHARSLDLVAGDDITFVAQFTNDVQAHAGLAPVPLNVHGRSAELYVTTPEGQEIFVPMNDLGVGPDEKRNDGKLTASAPATTPGEYKVRINITGELADGQEITRTAQHLIVVEPSGASIAANAIAEDRADGALELALPLEGVTWRDKLLVAAELWGQNDLGESVPVCWVSGMVANDQLNASAVASFRVDKRWFSRAGATGSLELRNVRVQDPDSFVPLTKRNAVPVRHDPIDLQGIATDPPIDHEMLWGLRDVAPSLPSHATPTAGASRAFGAHNLMLVHGYCSSFPLWPAGDFDGFLEFFQDPAQNRSHDEFAQLLHAFGEQSKSYGVIAHSQGGAAALHLYTYYWSGLDWATGPRLIQSVGTPYQGTPLAGDVALLGDIFGTGCGPNTDLSTEGAALWLAGIPTAARQAVHYWTTSFEDGFGFDYCNIVSDFFLSDPDDGVIEQARGQLPGATNMGHTEGQCHTTGMRDPAHYLDVSRNINMNTNAAR